MSGNPNESGDRSNGSSLASKVVSRLSSRTQQSSVENISLPKEVRKHSGVDASTTSAASFVPPSPHGTADFVFVNRIQPHAKSPLEKASDWAGVTHSEPAEFSSSPGTTEEQTIENDEDDGPSKRRRFTVDIYMRSAETLTCDPKEDNKSHSLKSECCNNAVVGNEPEVRRVEKDDLPQASPLKLSPAASAPLSTGGHHNRRNHSSGSVTSLPTEVSPPTLSIMERHCHADDDQDHVVAHGQSLPFEYAHLYTDQEIEKICRFVREVHADRFSGWLEKKNPIMWGYKIRYVEIKGFQLFYYKHRSDAVPKGMLDLSQTNWTLRLDRNDPFVFTLKAENQNRMYVWRVLTRRDAVDQGLMEPLEPGPHDEDAWQMLKRDWWFERLRRKLKAVTFSTQLGRIVDPTKNIELSRESASSGSHRNANSNKALDQNINNDSSTATTTAR